MNMTRAATNPKDAFFKAWQVYRSDESKKWRRSINSSSGHIVSMSLTELSLGRFLARIASLRFAQCCQFTKREAAAPQGRQFSTYAMCHAAI